MSDRKWKTVIESKTGWFDFHFREVWNYRDLCWMFIKKNYITRYKQTILGPLYMILSPLLTSGLFTVIFGSVVGIDTNGIPNFLFYMIGNLTWSFFSGSVFSNNNTFGGNAYIMGKVYFPRLIIPLSTTLTHILNSLFQFVMFIAFYIFYLARGYKLQANLWVLVVPLLFLTLVLLGVGIGLIVSSLTIKYRDLNVMLGFGMTLLMYASPVLYPINNFSGIWREVALLNPAASILEAIRYAFFGQGIISIFHLIYSLILSLGVLAAGLLLFNRVEKTFIDTI